MSTPLSGANNQYERVVPVSKSPTYASEGNDSAAQAVKSAPNYNNMDELKRAELRGEHYSVSDEQVVRAIERAIEAMQGKSTRLEFSVHEKTKMIAVKVIDKDSGETIREIPPEKMLDLVAGLWEMAGIIIDEKR